MESEGQNQIQETDGQEGIEEENLENLGNNEPQNISQAILVMLFLLVINEALLWILGKIKNKSNYFKAIQPTTITTTLGIGAGLFLNLVTRIFHVHIIEEIQSSFANFFLIVLLPPILYESAINMEIKNFFKNFGSILMFSMLGTTVATFVTSLLVYLVSIMGLSDFTMNHCFAFGSLISATDPVAVLSIFRAVNADQIIYTLIFGESTLNDAVAMILYDTSYEIQISSHMTFSSTSWAAIKHFSVVFFGSMFIGIMIGIISAYLLKDGRSSLNTEITILIAVPWTSYLIASMFKLSGILSIMSCGISMAKYALPNITSTGQTINHKFYHTLAYNFENLAFLFIGIGIVSFDLAWSQMGIFFFLIVFIIINFARYVNIEFCSYFLNKYRLRHPINKVTKFTMWFSGFRGAMAYALALQSTQQFTDNNAGKIMLTITLIYAIINIFINASMLEYMIEKLDIKQKPGKAKINNNIKRYDGFWNHIREIFEIFDDNCLQRVLITNQQELANRQNDHSTFNNDDDDRNHQNEQNHIQNDHESPNHSNDDEGMFKHNHISHQNEDEQFQSNQSITPNPKQRELLLSKQSSQQQDDENTPKQKRQPKRKQSKRIQQIQSARGSKTKQKDDKKYKDLLHTEEMEINEKQKNIQKPDTLDSPEIKTDRVFKNQNHDEDEEDNHNLKQEKYENQHQQNSQEDIEQQYEQFEKIHNNQKQKND